MASHRDRILDQFSQQAVPFSTAGPIRDEKALRLLVEATGAGAHDTVLDVACGPGLVACAFGRVARQVTGIDLTPAMIEQARQLATEQQLGNVTFQVGDVVPLPFPAATFSIVVSRFAFHHFPEPARVLSEMAVCRPGGRVAVADLIASADPERQPRSIGWRSRDRRTRALTLDELRALFVDAGLRHPPKLTGACTSTSTS
jgi:ubiquinone/menaquinone biosynthesis C-methylase UbiE